MAEYMKFCSEGAEFYRNAIRKANLQLTEGGNGHESLLTVPLLIVDSNQKIALLDPVISPEELIIPTFNAESLSRKVRFVKLIRRRLSSHFFDDFTTVAPRTQFSL